MKIGAMILAFVGRALRAGDPSEGKRLLVETVRNGATAHHIDFVEIDDDCRWLYPQGFNADLYRRLKDMADEIGLEWTIHLPIVGTDPCAPNEFIRRASVDATLESIEATRIFQPALYVFHAVCDQAGHDERSPEPTVRQTWHIQREHAARSVEAVLKEVDRERLCIENLPEMAPEHTTALAREFGTALCFDVGHMLLFGGDPAQFLDANLAQTREIHLHDVVKDGERLVDHRALGTGIVPVADLVGRFAQTDGYLTVEVTGWRAFQRSMTALEELGFLPPAASAGAA
ncbi:MAG: cobamide remodeling phosphodiesterase CbiR [Chloroflexota bacterium]|nr:cobamide remodeling phosphodiesterase CbiR [Chloroflexota bacterium]